MIPLPGSSSRWASSQASLAEVEGRRSTPSRKDARDSGPRRVKTSPPYPEPTPSCSLTSSITRSFAVAVVASTATESGSCASMSLIRR